MLIISSVWLAEIHSFQKRNGIFLITRMLGIEFSDKISFRIFIMLLISNWLQFIHLAQQIKVIYNILMEDKQHLFLHCKLSLCYWLIWFESNYSNKCYPSKNCLRTITWQISNRTYIQTGSTSKQMKICHSILVS